MRSPLPGFGIITATVRLPRRPAIKQATRSLKIWCYCLSCDDGNPHQHREISRIRKIFCDISLIRIAEPCVGERTNRSEYAAAMHSVTDGETSVVIKRIRRSGEKSDILYQSAIIRPFRKELLFLFASIYHEDLSIFDCGILDLSYRQASHSGEPLSYLIPSDPAEQD